MDRINRILDFLRAGWPASIAKPAAKTARLSGWRSFAGWGNTFYGEALLAAALCHLEKEPEWRSELIDQALKKLEEKNGHEDFIAYGLQECGLNPAVNFQQFFWRKASNRVLLRSLVRKRAGGLANKLAGGFQARVILAINHGGGYVTDNTLRVFYQKRLSSQYHAFAVMLLAELGYEDLFKRSLEIIRRELLAGQPAKLRLAMLAGGQWQMRGRGQKQIFGYGALLYCLARAGYWEDYKKVEDYIFQFQRSDGSLPLVLTNGDPEPYLYSYNNLYDYLPFFVFCLAKAYGLGARN